MANGATPCCTDSGTDGVGPGYNLIFDKDFKHLYGTTVEGGSGGYGAVYEITP
jgi:hypothetical protein